MAELFDDELCPNCDDELELHCPEGSGCSWFMCAVCELAFHPVSGNAIPDVPVERRRE